MLCIVYLLYYVNKHQEKKRSSFNPRASLLPRSERPLAAHVTSGRRPTTRTYTVGVSYVTERTSCRE